MKAEIKIDKTFTSKEEMTNFLLDKYNKKELVKGNVIALDNLSFQFDVEIPLSFSLVGSINNQLSNTLSRFNYIFSDCKFKNTTAINNSQRELVFINCNFNKQLRILNRDQNLTIKESTIQNLDVSESKFGKVNSDLGKLRIKKCQVYNTNFRNATFFGLVDFYQTTFHENVIYYKTDFLNIIVFSASNFKKNLLFTYTLLNDKVIMRSTKFEKGFDLSLSVIKGHLAIFDIKHNYDSYSTKDKILNEKEYENMVSKEGNIPLQNKLETYRLMKVEFETQQNIAESLNFKLLEKKTYRKILSLRNNNFQNIFDRFALFLNDISNMHGTSYSRALLFVVASGALFLYFSMIATNSFEFSYNPLEWEFNFGMNYFFQFLIPTHKFDYMGNEIILTPCFYLFDFVGRLFVSYGIYQFIQAFRKFK